MKSEAPAAVSARKQRRPRVRGISHDTSFASNAGAFTSRAVTG
jgi:hypothetical protein